jgi:hypothetical protein
VSLSEGIARPNMTFIPAGNSARCRRLRRARTTATHLLALLTLLSILVLPTSVEGAQPAISNGQGPEVDAVSATLTWQTDIPSTSQVVLVDGSEDSTPTRRTPENISLVTTHKVVVSNLVPDTKYFAYVVSRGPDGAASSTFPRFVSFRTATISPTTPADYSLRAHGPAAIPAGSDLYFTVHSTLLSGLPAHLYYRGVDGLPPEAQIHLICRAYMPVINESGDCLTDAATGDYYAWNGTDMDNASEETVVRLRTASVTPPGQYSITLFTESGTARHSVTYRFEVTSPPQPIRERTLSTAPAIPGLRAWEGAMLALGSKWCDLNQQFAFGVESQVWYYDGGRVFLQMADYTGNPRWLDCARTILAQYQDNILSRGGGVQGWRIFPHGLTMNHLRNADAGSREAVLAIAKNSAFAPTSGANGPDLIRETAYIVETYVKEQQITGVPNPHLGKAVDFLLGDFDVIFRSDADAFQQSFFDGLAAEALIQYYEATSDPRVPPAIKAMLDFIWDNCWDQTSHMLKYSPLAVPGVFDTVSNNLVAPAFAWYWNLTGDSTYLTRGDELFQHALDQDISYSGKIFAQNYHWSFDYVRWRQGGRFSASHPAGNTLQLLHGVPFPSVNAVSATSASVIWRNDVPATGQVEFGASAGYEYATSIDLVPDTTHTVSLTGLAPNTLYHYRVRGVDAAGNIQISSDNTFTTPPVGFQASEGPWFNLAWPFRKKIVIDGTKISGLAPLQNFPVLISIEAKELSHGSSGGSVARPDGGDIVFADAKGVRLSSELESYESRTGAVVAWVRLPALTPGADTQFFVYFGNAGASDSARQSVWDSDFNAVWHLSGGLDGASGLDSSGNGRNASVVSVLAEPAAVGVGGTFSGEFTPTYMAVPRAAGTLVAGGALTVEAWVKPVITNPGVIVSNFSPDRKQGFELEISNEAETALPVSLKIGNSAGVYSRETVGTLQRQVWSHVVATFDGKDVRLYINGQLAPSVATGSPVDRVESSIQDLNIGRSPFFTRFNAYYYWGGLDEIRISSTVRSDAWIAAEYKNQSSPKTFYRLGPAEARPLLDLIVIADSSLRSMPAAAACGCR